MVERKKSAPPLPAVAQSRIGRKLRALYDTIASEPVPDRFRDLLADLERTHKAASEGEDPDKKGQGA